MINSFAVRKKYMLLYEKIVIFNNMKIGADIMTMNQNNNQNTNVQEETVYVVFQGMVMKYEEYKELIESLKN